MGGAVQLVYSRRGEKLGFIYQHADNVVQVQFWHWPFSRHNDVSSLFQSRPRLNDIFAETGIYLWFEQQYPFVLLPVVVRDSQ
jgi:hypothetical protein